MDIILEFILSLFVEGASEGVKSKRIPLGVRYLLAVLLSIFFGGVILVLLLVGAKAIVREPLLGSCLLALGLWMMFHVFKKGKNIISSLQQK